QFYAELGDESEDAWCRKTWPGNGRCEGNENTAAGHSFEDCGELKKRGAAAEAPLLPPELPQVGPTTCSSGQVRTADGRCVARLKGAPVVTKPVKPAGPRTCGNGVCEPARGESSRTCCQDCPCDAPLVCKLDGADHHTCQAKGLK